MEDCDPRDSRISASTSAASAPSTDSPSTSKRRDTGPSRTERFGKDDILQPHHGRLRVRFGKRQVFREMDNNELVYRSPLRASAGPSSRRSLPHPDGADNIATAMIARARKRHVSETRAKIADILDFAPRGRKDSLSQPAISPMSSSGGSWWPWPWSKTRRSSCSTRSPQA